MFKASHWSQRGDWWEVLNSQTKGCNLILENPCGCDNEECIPCGEFNSAIEQEERDEIDRRINWKDYI